MSPGDAQGLAAYVYVNAGRYGLDPRAVMSVATQEGIGGGIGDNGTSFGPWQLHQGGAYPGNAPQAPQAANTWAWSPAGINYALAAMSKVAKGQTGARAVRSIVYRFERPANPGAEYAGALKVYNSNAQVVGTTPIGTVSGPIPGAVGSVVGAAESVGSFLSNITSAGFWIRALEVVGGGAIMFVGLYLLARQVGLAPSAQQAVRAAPGPVGEAARSADLVAGRG